MLAKINIRNGLYVCAFIIGLASSSAASLATEKGPDILFTIADSQHVTSDQEPSCAPGDNHTWTRGLWRWDATARDFTNILGGCRSCADITDTAVCKQRQIERGDYLKQLIAYTKSSVAVSPDGRWAAVSGLSLDLPDFTLKPVTERPTFDVGNVDPIIRSDHYRVLLIDLAALEAGDIENAVFNVLDTYRRSVAGPKTVTNDPILTALWPGLVARELGVNPLSQEGAEHENFLWEANARIALEFVEDLSERGFRLYMRVLQPTVHEADPILNSDIPLQKLHFDYENDRIRYHGAHLSFVVDFTEPDFPELHRTVIPNQPYVSTQTLVETDKAKPVEAYTLSPLLDGWQYIARGTLMPIEIAGKWKRWFKKDKFVYMLQVESHEEADKWFDNPVGPPTKPVFANYYAVSDLFDPIVRWFDDQLFVRTGLSDGSIFRTTDIIEHAPDSDLDDRPIAVEPFRQIADTREFDFHDMAMSVAWGYGFRTSMQPFNQVLIQGDHMVLTEHRILGGIRLITNQADIDFGYVFDWGERRSDYLIYPSTYAGKKTNPNAKWKPSNREFGHRFESDLLSPADAAQAYEASPEQIRLTQDGSHVYFLEARPTMDVNDDFHDQAPGLLDLYRNRMVRKEPFWQMQWPALARVSFSDNREQLIERLGHRDGEPGWFTGLDVEDYNPENETTPAQGVTSYAIVGN